MSDETVIPTTLPTILDTQALITTALEHGGGIDTLERLFALREKLHAEAARTAFFTALAAFQAECPIIGKDREAQIDSRTGRSYKYRYAALDTIVRQVGALLGKHGLSFTINAKFETAPPAQLVTCTVHHLAGHSESADFRMPIDSDSRMNVPQQHASALTYAKRYAFCNALGILTGDDDDDTESIAAKKFKPLTPMAPVAMEQQDGEEHQLPLASPPAATINAGRHRALEKAIEELEDAWGRPRGIFREEIKRRMAENLGVEHFPELTIEHYEQVMGWINEGFRRKVKA